MKTPKNQTLATLKGFSTVSPEIAKVEFFALVEDFNQISSVWVKFLGSQKRLIFVLLNLF